MRILIKGTNLELTEGIRRYIDQKIGGLEKFSAHGGSAFGGKETINESSVARVEIGITTKHHKSGPIYRAEVNLSVPDKHLLRAEAEAPDLYQAIDEVKLVLEKEINKHKKSVVSKKHRAAMIFKKIKSLSPLAWFKGEFRKGKREKEKF